MDAVPTQKRPGSLQALAILTLISGILNCLGGLTLVGLVLATFGITLLPGAYLVVLGILEIVYAARILPDPVTARQPARYLAIMEIVAVVCGQLYSLVVGILALVFYNQSDVAEYFRSRWQAAAG